MAGLTRMAITDPLVLPADAHLLPVAELPEGVRDRIASEDGDFTLTRPGLRSPSRVLDALSAALVAEFRSPSTVVEAVIRLSRAQDLDPEATLNEAFPLLENLLALGFLVEAGSQESAGLHPAFAPGDRIGSFVVLGTVRPMEDGDVLQARCTGTAGFAALKVERRPGSGGDGWPWEAAVLTHLAGQGAPRLLDQGEIEPRSGEGGRRWLAVEWLPGTDAGTAAAELRRAGDRLGLLALARSLAAAYADLHRRGVIHGDVHGRNVLVGADGGVRLVDFAGARRLDGAPGAATGPRGRAGVGFFFEPECALALRSGTSPPAPSAAGEQYSLATLLYLLLNGSHYLDFSLERDEMMRQIAEDPPLPFAESGGEPWPEVEAVLGRALRKPPEERFASVAELAAALDETAAPAPGPRWSRAARSERADLGRARELLESALERYGPAGPFWPDGLPEPPRLSLEHGAAGIAYALYRVALGREDPALLARADHWAVLAAARREEAGEEGFHSAALEITAAAVGPGSVYHGAAGVACVRALLAQARDDATAWREAIGALLAAPSEAGPDAPDSALDLTLGRSGLLLAAALLCEASRGGGRLDAAPLREWGEDRLAALWRELDAEPEIAAGARRLGMAHGWAGYLYATLRWCQAVGRPLPPGLERRLDELAGLAQPWERGLRWPWYEDGGTTLTMPGWCNGSAGFVHLWNLAAQVLDGERWAALADGAAWHAWEAPSLTLGGGADLCCGLAGRAYALLEHHRRHPDRPRWLERARELALRATAEVRAGHNAERLRDSLYKGELGVALLIADLERPEAAAMPFFGEEGWP
jgi:serine/threonine-protein kinase